jgi:spermidine/putrescine transport system permease protein
MSVARVERRGNWLRAYAWLFLAFLYGPLLFLPLFSLNDSIFATFPFERLTLRWYAEMAADEALIDALWNSIEVGAIVAMISTVLGTLGALGVTRHAPPGRGPIVAFVMLPLIIPGIVLGVALLVVGAAIGLRPSLAAIMVGHVILCVPFSMAVMISRLEGFDRSLEEASRDLGETPWTTFWRVTFPLAAPGILSSLLLSFTTSFDEFVVAFFLSGNEATLPVYIWSQLRFPARLPAVLALGTLILLASLVLVALAEWLRRMGVRGSALGVAAPDVA